MNDEIKEIDITKDLYLCSPLLNTECMKENCYINNGTCCHTVNKEHSQQHLLDYITNLQQENKRLKEIWKDTRTFIKDDKKLVMNKNGYDVFDDYKSRIEKAVEYINKNKHLSMFADCREPEEDWFYDLECSANDLLDILNGRSDE